MSDLGNKQIMADNILYYMNLNGKTRNDLCRDLGFKYTTVTGWLTAEKYPRIDKIEIMARYFGINKSDLVEKRNPVNNNGISTEDMALLRSLSKADLDILLSLARQMKQKETQPGR